MQLTNEQNDIVQCEDPNLTVNAFAGSGKTSTLVVYSEFRPNARILYICFNSAVAAEARTRFPANVECKTSHSLAFSRFGSLYKNKLGNPRAKDAVEYLRTILRPGQMGKDQYFFAQIALRRVSSFFATGGTHADIPDELDNTMLTNPSGEEVNPAHITQAARLLWAAMKAVGNTQICMPHDGYLKLFQLSQPDLSRYDIILLDEAQDTNPCVLNIVKRQKMGKVLVGDRHQNIYGFRGSINAMAHVEGTMLALTSSFRFGSHIAETANAILHTFCGEEREIQGLSQDRSAVTSRCYLHRTNSGLFDKAIQLVTANERLNFVGGVNNYQFEVINDTWRLHAGLLDIKDPFIRRFNSYNELADYAESVDDREIKGRMKIVDNYGSAIPGWVERLNRSDTHASQATAFLTTAHKSKGMEWDFVELGDDFPDMMIAGRPKTVAIAKSMEAKALGVEEANLIYVASTRAKKVLHEFPDMQDFTKWYSGDAD